MNITGISTSANEMGLDTQQVTPTPVQAETTIAGSVETQAEISTKDLSEKHPEVDLLKAVFEYIKDYPEAVLSPLNNNKLDAYISENKAKLTEGSIQINQ